MIPRREHRILVQGLTGKQGTFWSEKMMEYGANLVGGVHPKKAGTEHLGLPVHATARDAAGEFDIAVMFIPPMAAKTTTCQVSRSNDHAAQTISRVNAMIGRLFLNQWIRTMSAGLS